MREMKPQPNGNAPFTLPQPVVPQRRLCARTDKMRRNSYKGPFTRRRFNERDVTVLRMGRLTGTNVMKARSLSLWFMWCSLAGFGVILPLAIGQNPDHEILVHFLRALGGAGFVIGLVALIRSSGDNAPGSGANGSAPVVPRTLCGNPLAAAPETVPLAERIDVAAAASSFYGRSFGVIVYNLDCYERIAGTSGAPAADAAMDFVVGMLQMLLRDTDRIERVDKGSFVICVALLPDQDTLFSVHDRTIRAMRNMRVEALRGAPIRYDMGMALSPVHGHTGAALIAHAQKECDAAREQRIAGEARRLEAGSERRRAA